MSVGVTRIDDVAGSDCDASASPASTTTWPVLKMSVAVTRVTRARPVRRASRPAITTRGDGR